MLKLSPIISNTYRQWATFTNLLSTLGTKHRLRCRSYVENLDRMCCAVLYATDKSVSQSIDGAAAEQKNG